MSHYKPNLRDIEFNLFELFNRQELLGTGQFEEMDVETARDVLAQVARLAQNELAESLIDSDRNPPNFDPTTHTATLPESFKTSYKAYQDAEWWRLDVPEEFGGVAVPRSLRWAVAELVLGSNPAVHIYSAGPAFATILHGLGTPDQQRLAQLMIEGLWGCTMVLTEPDAGSDVGAGRTRAVQQSDGSWHLTGVKRFITSADADIYDNVVHLVLARPEGAGPGTKGLSLFAVPMFHVDLGSGELGERNGVFVTGVEHKMGLKVSTTCELRFGEVDGIPAVGTLVGDVHDGIAQMFRVIEAARMMVGTKAIATLSTGYLNALEYAKERVQGADLTATSKDAPRVTITHHPDVRRSLMLQKCYAEGLRALLLYTATQQDAVQLDPENELAAKVNDLLLPIVKGVGSERAWVLLGSESLQTFGGSGFLQDYPLEQYVRDAKIDTLYEGTTAIQAQDFFFRKVLRDRGVALGQIAREILATTTESDELVAERAAVTQALAEVNQMVTTLTEHATSQDPQRLYLVGQHATRLLMAVGDLLIGWLLVRQAQVAIRAIPNAKGADLAFYQGKVAAAHFFCATVLPHLGAERRIVAAADNALMELPESAF